MDRDQIILSGWQDIAKVWGISVEAAKRRAKRYGMPCVRLCGKVTIARTVLVEWIKQLSEGVKDDKGGDVYVDQLLKNLKKGRK